MNIASTGGPSRHELRDPKTLTVTFASAQKITGLGLTTLWKLAKESRIEIVRIGRRTLITYPSLEKLLLPEPASSTPPHRRRGRPPKQAIE
jgi:hypothetical protein